MQKSWWKETVIYQIYPRSFYDSDGDGIGDLKGIISKLDYLKDLGVDMLWLSPIFQSPNDDNGYDVSDYCDIMTEFGSMADFDEMLAGLHDRDMKLMLDLVPNHSSDEHRWFQESRKSRDNPYSDYYHWYDDPPSNWQSFFSGSTWEYDELRGEYYLHLFSKKQPDLNWENPKVRQEIYDVMHFWFKKGIDGFRIDVLPFISKRLDFPQTDPKHFRKAVDEVYANGPRIHEYLREMNEEVLSKYNVTTMAEGVGIKPPMALDYVGDDRKELHMLYHFDHVTMNYGPGGKYDPKPWTLIEFKNIFQQWYDQVGDDGWINLTLDNHDFPRMVSRFGNDKAYRIPSSKMLAMLLLTLRGTPCIYQGSEIGMTNITLPSLDDYEDVEVVNLHAEYKAQGKDTSDLLKAVQIQGRDNARTPVQWDDTPNAGFSKGTPWLPVNPNYVDINVKQALHDEMSIFHFYKELLSFRKTNKTLIYGEFQQFLKESEKVFVYRRWDSDGDYIVMLNFSSDDLDTSQHDFLVGYKAVMSNYSIYNELLKAWEGRIYKNKV